MRAISLIIHGYMPKTKQRTTTNDNSSKPRAKKVCAFCTEKLTPAYTDIVTLRRFTSARGKIVGKQRSGVCSKHQRFLTREIKHARHLALLPFSVKI
jgi:small subunit ribosomal protein S18